MEHCEGKSSPEFAHLQHVLLDTAVLPKGWLSELCLLRVFAIEILLEADGDGSLVPLIQLTRLSGLRRLVVQC